LSVSFSGPGVKTKFYIFVLPTLIRMAETLRRPVLKECSVMQKEGVCVKAVVFYYIALD